MKKKFFFKKKSWNVLKLRHGENIECDARWIKNFCNRPQDIPSFAFSQNCNFCELELVLEIIFLLHT